VVHVGGLGRRVFKCRLDTAVPVECAVPAPLRRLVFVATKLGLLGRCSLYHREVRLFPARRLEVLNSIHEILTLACALIQLVVPLGVGKVVSSAVV